MPSSLWVNPPKPAHIDTIRRHHGDTVIDPFEWLRDKNNPEVVAHLEAENSYADARTAHLSGLRENIFNQIKKHTQETDLSVPVRDGDWWYITRTTQGQQYPIFTRLPFTDEKLPEIIAGELLPDEQIILDCQALAEGKEFFQLGGATISEDHRLLAYSVDTQGNERFSLTVVDLASGQIIDQMLSDIGYGLGFTIDGKWIYYSRLDSAWRQYQIWRHQIGTLPNEDQLVLEELDSKFSLYFSTSRDGLKIITCAVSTTSTECRLIDLTDTQAKPEIITSRQPGLEYGVEVAGDQLLIVHNANHIGFELSCAPMGSSVPAQWQTIMAAKKTERFEQADYFKNAIALSLRAEGLAGVRIIPRDTTKPLGWNPDSAWNISSGGELDTIYLGDNRQIDTETLRYGLTSLLIPDTVAEINLATRESKVLRETPVPGYDRNQYQEHRLWAKAQDGTSIPVSLVAKRDVIPDGTNPGLLYGYGAYEAAIDLQFSVMRLPLLDRGVVYAIAHIRGGGELGRPWYEQGKMLNKKNSFTDFVDVAKELINTKWVSADRLAAEGGSAGGLLVGAAINLAPELFRAVLAIVPFVDSLTTILDPSLPLTVGEWEEWGDPLHDKDVYYYMKSYTPYENIRAVEYPAIMASTSLHDTRVYYVEPAKWIAKLRERAKSDQRTRPIILRCEMVAGHGGKSGRYDRWRQRADELAFVLDQIGLS